MEELQTRETIEELFKSINAFGSYNYYFTTRGNSVMLAGALGGLIGTAIYTKAMKGVMGYVVNKYDEGICLIPIVADGMTKNKIDIENVIHIKEDEIETVKIKSVDFGLTKEITIKLKNKKKYSLATNKKIKNMDYHEENLNQFIEYYQKK